MYTAYIDCLIFTCLHYTGYSPGSLPTSPEEVSEMEKQRQHLINELIDTEEQYVHDINIVKDVSSHFVSTDSYYLA